jgi:hypothetical protein
MKAFDEIRARCAAAEVPALVDALEIALDELEQLRGVVCDDHEDGILEAFAAIERRLGGKP